MEFSCDISLLIKKKKKIIPQKDSQVAEDEKLNSYRCHKIKNIKKILLDHLEPYLTLFFALWDFCFWQDKKYMCMLLLALTNPIIIERESVRYKKIDSLHHFGSLDVHQSHKNMERSMKNIQHLYFFPLLPSFFIDTLRRSSSTRLLAMSMKKM